MVAGRQTTCPRTRHDYQRCCFDQGFRVIQRTASIKDGRQNFMKRCPECRRDYYDDSLMYCLDDGTALLEGPASSEQKTVILESEGSSELFQIPSPRLSQLTFS